MLRLLNLPMMKLDPAQVNPQNVCKIVSYFIISTLAILPLGVCDLCRTPSLPKPLTYYIEYFRGLWDYRPRYEINTISYVLTQKMVWMKLDAHYSLTYSRFNTTCHNNVLTWGSISLSFVKSSSMPIAFLVIAAKCLASFQSSVRQINDTRT